MNPKAAKSKAANRSPDWEQIVADLAWAYCDEVRQGRPTRMEPFLSKLPNNQLKQEFQLLVGMSGLAEQSIDQMLSEYGLKLL